jgi:hypothetical protein
LGPLGLLRVLWDPKFHTEIGQYIVSLRRINDALSARVRKLISNVLPLGSLGLPWDLWVPKKNGKWKIQNERLFLIETLIPLGLAPFVRLRTLPLNPLNIANFCAHLANLCDPKKGKRKGKGRFGLTETVPINIANLCVYIAILCDPKNGKRTDKGRFAFPKNETIKSTNSGFCMSIRTYEVPQLISYTPFSMLRNYLPCDILIHG